MSTRPKTAGAPQGSTTVDSAFHNLDARLKLLANDRKTIHETASSKVAQNQQIIDALTSENKGLKQTLIAVARLPPHRPVTAGGQRGGPRGGPRGAAPGSPATSAELVGLTSETSIEALRREINKLGLQLDAARYDLRRRQDAARKLGGQVDLYHQEIERPEPVIEEKLAVLRDLETRLDDACIKERETAAVRGTYAAILDRLRQERVYFDRQVAALEALGRQKDEDIRQLHVYLQEALAATSLAREEYAEYEAYADVDRASRRAALARRRQEVDRAQEDERRGERLRGESRGRAEAQLRAGLAAERLEDSASDDLQDSLTDSVGAAGAAGGAARPADRRRARLDCYRATMERVRESTNVSQVPELVSKALEHARVHGQLAGAVDEFNRRLTDVMMEITNYRTLYADAQFNADTSGSRRMLDRIELTISEERFRNFSLQQRHRATIEALSQLSRGVHHIVETVALVNDGAGVADSLRPMPIATEDSPESQEAAIAALVAQAGAVRRKIALIDGAVTVDTVLQSSMRVTQKSKCVTIGDDEEVFNVVDGSLVDHVAEENLDEGDIVNTLARVDLPGTSPKRDEYDGFMAQDESDVDDITTRSRGLIKRRSELMAARAKAKQEEEAY